MLQPPAINITNVETRRDFTCNALGTFFLFQFDENLAYAEVHRLVYVSDMDGG